MAGRYARGGLSQSAARLSASRAQSCRSDGAPGRQRAKRASERPRLQQNRSHETSPARRFPSIQRSVCGKRDRNPIRSLANFRRQLVQHFEGTIPSAAERHLSATGDPMPEKMRRAQVVSRIYVIPTLGSAAKSGFTPQGWYASPATGAGVAELEPAGKDAMCCSPLLGGCRLWWVSLESARLMRRGQACPRPHTPGASPAVHYVLFIFRSNQPPPPEGGR